jgi:Tfp pilus assembly protein PilX
MSPKKPFSSYQRGGILVMTMVFVSMFAIIFLSLTGLVTRQYHQTVLQAQDEQAFHVAESGLNYGRWRLSHDGSNFNSETRSVSDQLSGVIGSYDLSFIAPPPGQSVVVITSVGRTVGQPTRQVTLQARYGKQSLTRFVFITNSDVWYDEDISGVVHANGGIRMDGKSDSLMTSAKQTYTCKPIHGCNNEVKPGIWGTGTNQALWQFPVEAVDYTAFVTDLLAIKTAAQNSNTYYGPSGVFGYHIVFNSNNTYSIYKVTKKAADMLSYDSDTGWQNTSHDIDTETLLETKTVPANGVIYTEDTLWVQGDIRSRISVAAGRFPDTPATNADIIINGDISYGGVRDGTRVFGAIAQRNVLLPWSGAPKNLNLDGAFIAQKGKFGRRYYTQEPFRLLGQIKFYGMIASNLPPVTAWVDGTNHVISGYQETNSTYDPNLLYGPPPDFPTTGSYEFISWEQLE